MKVKLRGIPGAGNQRSPADFVDGVIRPHPTRVLTMVAFLILLVPLALFFRGITRVAAVIAIAIIVTNTDGLTSHNPLLATVSSAQSGQ